MVAYPHNDLIFAMAVVVMIAVLALLLFNAWQPQLLLTTPVMTI